MAPGNFARLEELIPGLLCQMRQDFNECVLCREFVLLKKVWSYTPGYPQFMYFYDDHADLDSQIRILQNYSLVEDISDGNVKRYVISEELAEYLTDQPGNEPTQEECGPFFRREGQTWMLSFEGKTIHVPHMVGL